MAIQAHKAGRAPLRDRVNGDHSTAAFIKVESGGDFEKASASALDSYRLIESTVARDRYRDVATDTSVRNEYGRKDYDYFRPGESQPQKSRDIIIACMNAYRKTGIIRNMIDLMADFASQGVRVVHPNPRVQRFYRAWFKKVCGPERTERASNYLYLCGQF